MVQNKKPAEAGFTHLIKATWGMCYNCKQL